MPDENNISQSTWTGKFFGLIVSPRFTLNAIVNEASGTWKGIEGAAILVTLASFVDGLATVNASDNGHFNWGIASIVIVHIICGVLGWLIYASAIALPAYVFGVDKSKIRSSFITTGWGFLPWLFMAPISLYHNAMPAISSLLSLMPALWIVYLECLALKESYKLTAGQTVLLVLFLPQLVMLAYCWWLIQIFGNILNLFVH